MYSFHICNLIDNNIFDEKIDISLFNSYIKKYNLSNLGKRKEYWINNVEIIKNYKNIMSYNYINDINIYYENNILIRNYEIEECMPFQFHDTDSECEYDLYSSENNSITFELKKYDTYFTFEWKSNNLDINV